MNTKTEATPRQTLQIHDLGDNARTDFDAQYPILLVAKDSYHNWAEEVPTEEFIIARFQRYDEARSILEAVNAHDALLEFAKKHHQYCEDCEGTGKIYKHNDPTTGQWCPCPIQELLDKEGGK